jgi:two-component system phosphate regulon response regulator PhoB
MRKYDILVTSELGDGFAPFLHDDISVAFHSWSGAGAPPLIDGTLWAFVGGEAGPASDVTAGIELCRGLRADPLTADAHVTVVVADDAEQKRRALRAGADDYIVGPISRRIILDRVLSLKLRLPENRIRQVAQLGDLTIDLTAFQARWKGRPIALRPSEFRLLRIFADHPDRVFTRTQLIEALGKHDMPFDERTVDVWVGRLRRALRAAGADDRLRTVRRLGYVFDRP